MAFKLGVWVPKKREVKVAQLETMRDYSVDVSKQVIDLISAEVKTFV